jgi:hypothetical protein
MPRVLPSQVVQAIEQMFGSQTHDLHDREINGQRRVEVHTLLSLFDQVPRELIDLSFPEFLELSRCQAVLATTLARWNVGDDALRVRDVGTKDPIERMRRLLKQCSDELPPAEPEVPFISDIDTRLGIQDQIHAAWTDFNAREWMGATVFAGTAMEAILLWAIKAGAEGVTHKKPPDAFRLDQLIDEAVAKRAITSEAGKQAHLAKDARNLIHPGKVARSGNSCSRATALTAFAGLYRVIEDLKAASAS